MRLPVDEDDFYLWILCLTAGYVGLAQAISCLRRSGFKRGDYGLARVFDGSTFAVSFMLLMGIVQPDLMKVIGSTKPFLLVAGLVGILYSLHALWPEKPPTI
jgi:hypothetical protein